MIIKQKKLSHAHSGLQSDGKQISVKSRQVMSKATMCWHSIMVDTKKILYQQGRQNK